MTTWTSPDGNIRGQIDYIAINAKRRNMARTEQCNIYWPGNMRGSTHSPGKLTKTFQEQEANEKQETKHDWREWEDYQKTLGKLREKYPLSKKAMMAKEPEWALNLKNGEQKKK